MGSARAGPGTLVPRPGSATRVRGADVVVREDRRARGAVNPAAPETPVGPGSSSWEAIVVEHSARVYRLAYRLTGNQHDAEDLTQEVFVRVFRSLSTYTPGTFEGWLHRITVNLFLDQMRRRQRVERTLDVAVEICLLIAPLGLQVARLAGESLGVGTDRIDPDALPTAHLVEEEVDRDPVQPALEGPGRVGRERAEDADEDLLREVLGVVLVPGEAIGQPIHPRRVLDHDRFPRGRSGAYRGLGRSRVDGAARPSVLAYDHVRPPHPCL